MDNDNSSWVFCESCQKKIAKRIPDGRIEFVFGLRQDGDPKVVMRIDGSIEIKCLRYRCGHVNTIIGRRDNPVV
jgi:hypothetical protein